MDDTTLRRLFSQTVTLQSEQGQLVSLAGPSFLFTIVVGTETDAAYRAKKGCISREKLHMLYGNERLNGIYKTSQLREIPELSEKTAKGIAFVGDIAEDGRTPAIGYEYKNCVGSVDFFYVPIVLSHATDPIQNPRHANGLIVSKSKGTYFRIEPQYTEGLENPKIDQGIENALNEIGAKNFTRTELNTTCPQNLTQDRNCLFWTAYLTRQILRNMYKNQDPNTTIAQVSAMGKDKLENEIKLFKESVWAATLKYLTERNITWREYEATRTQTAGVYWPVKYYRGLTRKQNLQRKRSATRRTKMSFTDPKAYVPFKSDKGVKTRKSSYTERFHKKYPGVKSLPEIAKATGISKSILQEVYDRGMAAWRTGHRPGASQQAWGMARVHSFVMKGKTWRTADADLASKVKSST
jgi:hypothetical protein